MAKEVISGVGNRYAVVYNLDSDGLPSINQAKAQPVEGSLVQGIKTLNVNDPTPQRITHYGDDRPFAQDSLPPTEVGSFTVTTGRSNLILDSMIEGNKVRSVDSTQWRGVNSDKKGNEPRVGLMVYRQALDTKEGSATFGSLQQWNVKIYGSARITPVSQSMEQAETDKSYEATPSPVVQTPWGETFDETNWGHTEAEAIEGVTDYHPRFNWYLGDGTITARELSHPPQSSSHLHVWVGGTLTTPSNVDTSSDNPAFTLTSAPTVGEKVFALIETNEPGNS